MSRRCPGESASPGVLVLCLLLFWLAGTAAASPGAEEPLPVSEDAGGGFSGLNQPLFRLLYVAGSRGALHPCPS